MVLEVVFVKNKQQFLVFFFMFCNIKKFAKFVESGKIMNMF